MTNQPNMLVLDIETKLLGAYLWQPGKQYVSHNQLIKGIDKPGIICAAWGWLGTGSAIESADWGYEEQDSVRVVAALDEQIRKADIVIGKNSDRFDVKVINSVRMLHNMPPMPQWEKYTDDLEKQMRRHFRLPSQSLDYISSQLGYGGKHKMEFSDWVNIQEKNTSGLESFHKMIRYNIKDVEDTINVWNRLLPYITPKFNNAVFNDVPNGCRHCASSNVFRNGTAVQGNNKYQCYLCRDCNKYAGRRLIGITKQGKMR